MKTVRLTTAQALVRYMKCQYLERDGVERPFFGGVLGILGHGNLAGVGQALQENPDVRFIPFRNEQAMVHAAVAYARTRARLGTLACTSSIGPGATNMVTGAALATINRLPVLLLPGDLFATRRTAPVLQQLESEQSQDVSVNDCFRPVSRYWDRINRPEQLVWSLPEAMRVLTSPSQTGAATLALPQDVQAEAFAFPAGLFEKRVWNVPRNRADRDAVARAAELLRKSRCPLLIAGGGVFHSEAVGALATFAARTGVPVAETQAGRSALPTAHPQSVGAVGATGTLAANRLAREADLVLAIGTRLADFTTASKTAFRNPAVRFVAVNVCEMDAHKQAALPLCGDARAVLEELGEAVGGWRVEGTYSVRIAELREKWSEEVARVCRPAGGTLPAQAEVIAALDDVMGPDEVIVNAAGSAPGDLHKLWRAKAPGTYHVEYGYSCMGYEIPAGIGIRLAAPEKRVCVLVGDGSYLMMPSEIVTAVQEDIRMTIVLVDNHGYGSIGGLSESLGSAGFGTRMSVPVDYVANAASLGAKTIRVRTVDELKRSYEASHDADGPVVIVVETDRERRVGGYESWWDVTPAEVSETEGVRQARAEWESARIHERAFHAEGGK